MLWLGYGGPLMCALAIRDDISPEEPRLAELELLDGRNRLDALELVGIDPLAAVGLRQMNGWRYNTHLN